VTNSLASDIEVQTRLQPHTHAAETNGRSHVAFATVSERGAAPGVAMALAALAIGQMGVHLVFFLHITTGPDNTNNVLALAFGALIVGIVIAGSLWIVYHLNINMMVPSGIMDVRTQP
jgi:cytochrome o ubiquinol oxidase subunit IV